MAYASMERFFTAEALDELLEPIAKKHYTRETFVFHCGKSADHLTQV
ncbi:MAG: hypothetical protein F6K42_09245 [Leptolyngbya sp. SIO1D8]|nr:hypothetical protein [Leptolyngbya sp. SIO1D8]